MSTFKELQKRLETARAKSAVYQHLVNHLDSEFRSVNGFPATKVIMTEDKTKVPEEMIDIVVKEILTGLNYSLNEISQIENLSIGPAPTEAAPTPVTQTPQGEVK